MFDFLMVAKYSPALHVCSHTRIIRGQFVQDCASILHASLTNSKTRASGDLVPKGPVTDVCMPFCRSHHNRFVVHYQKMEIS